KANEMVPERGTIISIPLLNVYGFINYSRSMPDGKDINRSFPGNAAGSLASRVAYQLMQQIIPLIDYGLDFHTGAANRENYPQVRCTFRDKKSLDLAKAIQPPYIINSPYRDKSLRKASYNKGKTMLVFEGGEALRFSEHAIEEGRNCALRLLNFLGMRSDAPEPTNKTVILKGSSWVRAKNSGLFVTNLILGDEAKKNQRVGNIKGPYGDFDLSLKAPSAGFVIGLNNNPVVNMGDAVMHIGLLNNEDA
ncbi:MAG: putative deacylase, partial [Sphingobacteriales bacterium]